MKNYRNEREHDEMLILLAQELNAHQRIDLLEEAFLVANPLGRLERALHRGPFDVELTFNGGSLAIETKVDADEQGRWSPSWQTETTWEGSQALPYLKQPTYCFFVTYGTSEYYRKPYECGPASKHFRHIALEAMVIFVEKAIQHLSPTPGMNKFQDWLSAMNVERQKRIHAPEFLAAFACFRRKYLDIENDVDFPSNRFQFSAPELAFPVFHNLAMLWNAEEKYCRKYGRVSVYPVSTMGRIHDSILNFREMREIASVGSDFLETGELLFFEINEDFNLHLKLWAPSLRPVVREHVHRRLQQDWGTDVRGKPWDYEQRPVFVLYEWDFGFLDNVRNIQAVADRLGTILDLARKALNIQP